VVNDIVSHNGIADHYKTDEQCHLQMDMLAGTEELALKEKDLFSSTQP
jgi:hypothetical protein